MKLQVHPYYICRGGFKGGQEECAPPPPLLLPYFLQSLVFSNHFEELRTMLFEVELIINNGPLIYVYPNTKSAKWHAQRAHVPYVPYVPTRLA